MELKGESDECDDDALEESMMMDSADEFDDDALEESMMMDSSDECYSGDDCDVYCISWRNYRLSLLHFDSTCYV